MESLIGQLPYASGVIAIVIIILGIAAGLYMLDGWRQKKRETEDKGEDRLITILQTTVTELEKKVNKQTNDIEKLTKKVDELERENTMLIRVLQGRDEQTQEFYKQAATSMRIANETHELVKSLHETKKDTNENIKRLIELMSKHVDVIAETKKG